MRGFAEGDGPPSPLAPDGGRGLRPSINPHPRGASRNNAPCPGVRKAWWSWKGVSSPVSLGQVLGKSKHKYRYGFTGNLFGLQGLG
jgi:hypothetical protein